MTAQEKAHLNHIATYLYKKGVPFMVKSNHINDNRSIVGVNITKEDKFYRANGVIIAQNIAKYFI